ncbi:OmpA family protein [Reinekea marina]|uniref:OmpA family protein n=1 Tax=Reinekea marina TaxID=1310421 RepID=A0ABV7WSN8_9GAMM|nr:OmpA family protein [Reinekea marina]MDN3649028.1 OmpA family protein [Reinekea marina]
MTSTQKMIFSMVALLMSLLANLFLYFENNQRQIQVTELTSEITTLETQNEQSQQSQRQRGEQVELMQSTQLELATMIRELQSALTNLKADYQKSQEIALLSAQQLELAKQQAKKFELDLETTRRQLTNADATIANLKRALENRTHVSNSASPIDSVSLSNLIKEVKAIDPNNEIGIVQKSDQSISISIPLETLFVPGTVQLRANAKDLLAPIAEGLNGFQDKSILVIGHSDERPITSSLSQNYPTNWELSAVRASKVLVNLIDQGVNSNRFTVAGKAANAPIRDESDATAWKVNRRIEIVID